MPETGEIAPDFTLPRDDGPPLTLSDQRGQRVVLFFYPRDATAGCTAQARGFSERLDAFTALGTQVWGISRDSLASHARFREKHALRVPLLSDAQEPAENGVCALYGVWREKKLYGRVHMGILRSTFLIGADGRIAASWTGVRVPGHVDAVYDAIADTR
ncbi:peroxiredoxin [Profundibacterium mesophilum]|uniref:thioredoxin-dependent peroxiredoxin n=1 Tax=Profundibacterium mesophilum KAUST100406-0324 TaxID=1037889 RepID=A0A921TET3_9RHOB|nr:peroxiredoxin [Profundibacterium mesophilum]KAF0677626.1 Bacterioferritin comigratory protein [Profundibacterium mesophilum KAUST100406-0324]